MSPTSCQTAPPRVCAVIIGAGGDLDNIYLYERDDSSVQSVAWHVKRQGGASADPDCNQCARLKFSAIEAITSLASPGDRLIRVMPNAAVPP